MKNSPIKGNGVKEQKAKLLNRYLGSQKLREDGIIWTDAQKRNLVRLKKDNNLPDWVIKEDGAMVGFYPTDKEHIVKKKGELVVCDLSSLKYKNDRINPYLQENLIIGEIEKQDKNKEMENENER